MLYIYHQWYTQTAHLKNQDLKNSQSRLKATNLKRTLQCTC